MRLRFLGRKGTVAAAAAVFFLLIFGGMDSPAQQNATTARPGTDYMKDVLRRNTKPIGLKEDKLLQKLLKQSNMKWAIRANGRHILD